MLQNESIPKDFVPYNGQTLVDGIHQVLIKVDLSECL